MLAFFFGQAEQTTQQIEEKSNTKIKKSSGKKVKGKAPPSSSPASVSTSVSESNTAKKKRKRNGKKKQNVKDSSSDSDSDSTKSDTESDDDIDLTVIKGTNSLAASKSAPSSSSSSAIASSAVMSEYQTNHMKSADPLKIVVDTVMARSKELGLSFTRDFAAVCVTEMFDTGRPYDNAEAVINYLKQKTQQSKEDFEVKLCLH